MPVSPLPRLLVVVAGLLSVTNASAQVCTNAQGGPNIGLVEFSTNVPGPVNGCGFACNNPRIFAVRYELRPLGCDPTVGTCTVRAYVPLEFPGNKQNTQTFGNSPVKLTWTDSGSGFAGACGSGFGEIKSEKGEAWIETGGFSCAQPGGTHADTYTLRIRVCDGYTFCPMPNRTTTVDLTGSAMASAVCPPPPKTWGCGEDDSCEGGCLGPGGAGGGSSSPAGGGPGLGPPRAGPGATMRYQAGGVGTVGHPLPADWTTLHGRFWSHDYAERIVEDPDASHVWLVTRAATFREFTDANADDVYEITAPSDEYRTLTKTAGGWELGELDGMVHAFDADGRWTSTTDRHGNAKTATYDVSDRLERVDFPDGRHETFSYDGAGRLETITEVGVDGSTSRAWTLTWAGDDLSGIDRPDGTSWSFRYDDARHPGFMTRMTLVGTDGTSERVEGAWEFDAQGNVVATWRGAIDKTDPDAVELWELQFDDPSNPESTTVTDPLGTVSTYTLGRDTVDSQPSQKPRIDQISGDCPTCGLGPNSQAFFDDPNHPLRPTRKIDGRGFETLITYDANGMQTSVSEAVGEPEERLTTWTYDATYPALVTRIEHPSTTGNPLDLRTVDFVRDAGGEVIDEIHEGVERGAAFSYTTERTYTAEGMVDTVDEPGDGTADLVTFSYDTVDRGGLVLEERIDPLIGSTFYGNDPLNRQTSITDPNGVVTETEYDALDRTRFVRQKGAAPDGSEDLVTEYRYNVFGDLFQVVLPAGNVIENSYDTAGRVTSIERKADDQPATHGERVRYELDGYGHRTLEVHERWDADAMDWVEHARTEFVYSTRCHLDRVIAGDTGEQSVTEYAYDCNGNLEQIWDANHPSAGQTNPPTTTYFYDSLDRLDAVEQPFGGVGGGTVLVDYDYNVQDHLVEIVDGEGTVTSYTYSDRDLLTQEVSEVAGTTEYVYTVDALLATKTDARGIVETRSYDLLDRPTGIDYPGTDLDIVHTYDDPLVDFSLGRLTRIERDGHTIDYRYDRFGRLTQDGALGYAFDANSNRAAITYPGDVTAAYSFDYADRPSTLTVQRPGEADEPVVTASSYHPGGPLAGLSLGNGLEEMRDYDTRYFPRAIVLDTPARAPLLDWQYTVDAVGNPTAIVDGLNASNNRSYGYQDIQYFLTQGDGPWGTRAWTYDTIGNRLSETTNGAAADTYAYEANAAGNNSPTLDAITLGIGGVHDFTFDAAGNQTQVDLAGNVIDRAYDAASRMSRQERVAAGAWTEFRYDGRGFLCRAEGESPPAVGTAIFCDGFESGDVTAWGGGGGGSVCLEPRETESVYSSEGRLHAVSRSFRPTTSRILYFGDRPVAQIDTIDGGEQTLFLTTDHLGTPILASDGAGAVVWAGGFEPFGGDYAGADQAGVFLRFPGQWVDGSWNETIGTYYNVHRWFAPQLGGYFRPDPYGAIRPSREAFMTVNHLYIYALNNPGYFVDPLGLKVVIENPKVKDCYENFKECFPLFRAVAEHFENDRGPLGGERTWTVKDPDFTPQACMVGGRRTETRTIWVPPDRDCKGTIRCLFHELYELWLLRVGGFRQFGPAGPADDRARHGEGWIPYSRCCDEEG